jgi:fatty acid desaturase
MKSAPAEPKPLDKETKAYRELRAKLMKEGWFESSKLWYIYKTTETLGLTVLGLVLAAHGHWVLGGLLLGLGYQQQGWLSHDYCHQQVFKSRRLNNFFAYFCGSVCSGYSVNWWKERHNTHHAITNVLDADPDIDNLPLFVWDVNDFSRIKNVPGAAALVPYQHYYFVPWTMTLKLIWCIQSLFFVKTKQSTAWNNVAHFEKMCLTIHYTFLTIFCFLYLPSIGAAIAFLLLAEFVGGAGIANIVFMNHYGMEHPKELNTNFVSLQLTTTTDIDPSLWMNWFSGGLNLQIEHHLFPTMPRHNLLKLRPIVQKFCKDNGLPYRSQPFVLCMQDILGTLSSMSKEYLKVRSNLL